MATTYAEKRLALITAKTRAMNEAMDDEATKDIVEISDDDE